MEREVELLKERLEANHKALEATRSELELRENRFHSLDREYRETAHNVRTASTQFDLFREQLANLLSSVSSSVTPSEESLKETIRRLATDKRENDLVGVTIISFCLYFFYRVISCSDLVR